MIFIFYLLAQTGRLLWNPSRMFRRNRVDMNLVNRTARKPFHVEWRTSKHTPRAAEHALAIANSGQHERGSTQLVLWPWWHLKGTFPYLWRGPRPSTRRKVKNDEINEAQRRRGLTEFHMILKRLSALTRVRVQCFVLASQAWSLNILDFLTNAGLAESSLAYEHRWSWRPFQFPSRAAPKFNRKIDK